MNPTTFALLAMVFAPNGTVRKCISIDRHCINIVRSSSSVSSESVTSPVTEDEIVPDSGATSDMRKNRSVFEDDYVACNNVFVLIGDGHIPCSWIRYVSNENQWSCDAFN